MDNSFVSSDDDLEEFLKGLRQRYNLDAAPASSPTPVAREAAASSEAAGAVQPSGTSPNMPKSPVISTDAAILGLHPAFRGTLAQGVPSPSLKSGQPTSAAAAGEGTATTEAAAVGHAVQEPAAAGVGSPAAQSESGSCTTPQQQRSTASQLADAAAGQPATPTDITIVGADAIAWRAAAPAGGVGAVAAAATPHSTAAMPAAWQQTSQQSPAGQQQQQQVQGGMTQAQAMTLHAGAHEANVQSSASSSPGSISKPLLGAFTAAAGADAPTSPGLAPARAQQQPQQADSESEVTFQSLLDSPRQRQQRRAPLQAESPPQQPQQPHAPPAMAPGSPARPLLGAWAARAAAAAVGSSSPVAVHPAAGRAGSADLGAVGHAAASPEPVAAEAAAVSPANSASDGAGAAPPAPQQQQQQQQQVQGAPALDWGRLSSQLSAAGFGHLACMQQQGQEAVPQLADLHDNLGKVLHEYQRRDSLMQQLLSERDEMRRSSRRSNTESSKLERERDEAVKTAAKLKTELSDVRSAEIPAMESRHKEAMSKLNSEVARLKHAVKEAEAVAAAAQAEVLAASTQPTLQGQLHDAVRERERLRLECERLESELSRQKPLVKELEKSAAAARAASRQSADQAVLLDKQLRQLRQQHQEEQAVLTAELNKARHAAREAEQQLAAVRAEAAAGASEAPELLRQLAAEREQHEEQQAHTASELQGLRQQLLQLQQAAARAESAAKADSGAAVHAAKQLALQEKQHKAEVSKLSAEVKQARESLQLLQAKLIQAEAAAAEQAAAATGAEAAALESADRTAAAVVELDRVRTATKQQQQQLSEQLQDSRRTLAECQQQLASTQGELRRLRAAAGLADAVSGGTAAAAVAGEVPDLDGGGLAAEGSSGSALGLEPAGPARAMRPDADADSSRSSSRAAAAAAAVASAAATVAAATATGDLAAALSRAVAAESAAADAEGVLVGLRYKCMQLEMACSRKEQELDALRDRLAQKVTREERRLARDKAVYQRIKQAYAASGGAAAGRRAAQAAAAGSNAWSATVEIGPGAGGAAARRSNAAGAVAAAARELRPVELVGIYEGQKEALEKELAAAKAEARILSGQLRDAQNLLISRDRAAAVAAAAAGLKGSGLSAKLGDPAAAAAAQRKAAELQRELCTVRAEAASAVREAAKRLAETEAEVSQLRGDVNALQEELDNRPTAAEQRRLQREIDLLQRKIAAVRRQAAGGQPGGAAAAGEDALSAAVAAGDVWGADDMAGSSGRVRGTKTAIQRDKALARLGLHVVEEFPRDVLVDIVQDMCIVLELRDATLLLPSMKKLAAVAAAIPGIEGFMTKVCEVVLRQGVAFLPDEVQDTGLDAQCVPKVLQQWLLLLRQGELLSQFVGQLQQLVAQRCSNGAAVMPSVMPPAGDTAQLQQFCQQLVQGVQALLQVESEAEAAADVLGAAKGLMVSQPDGLLQRLLRQVMDLLGVQQLEGLPATVNKVYVHYNELLNFLRAAVSLLGLPADAGPSTVMATLAKLVEQSAQPPSKVRQAAAELQAASSQQQYDGQSDWQQQQQQWEADSSGPRAATAAAAAAATAAADEHLSALLAVLGATSEQQAADRAKEMVARLRRLDQVLPKYQSVVSHLYDKLRVVSLDELLPAFDRVMAQLSAAQRST